MPVPQRVHHILGAYTFHSCACRRSIACRTKLHVIIVGPPKSDEPIQFSFRSSAMRCDTSSQTWKSDASHNECTQMNACMAEKKRNISQLAHWSYHQTRCKGIQPVNGRPSFLVLYICQCPVMYYVWSTHRIRILAKSLPPADMGKLNKYCN